MSAPSAQIAYTVAEAARALRISTRSIYALIARGELVSCTIAGRRLVYDRDLRELVERSRDLAVTPIRPGRKRRAAAEGGRP